MTNDKKTKAQVKSVKTRQEELRLIQAGRLFQFGLDITMRVNEKPELLLGDNELDALGVAVAMGKKYRELVDFTQSGSEIDGNILFMGVIYQNMVKTFEFYSRRETFERAVDHFRGLNLSCRIFDQDSPYRRQLRAAKIKRTKQDYR